jgi:NAD-dependent deacetylase
MTGLLVPQYQRIVILSGAGISAESGIRTFRAADGLWEDHAIEEVATPEAFAVNPQLVQRFYNARRQQLLHGDVKPNPAHEALAHLETAFAGEFLLVTQNIDDLHERAGVQNLIHMHGELLKMRCADSGELFEIRGDIHITDRCPCCDQVGTLRPHVVWFGEMPLEMDRIYHALQQCDLFVAIGTSGNVYPAAGFVEAAAQAGAHTIELNLEPSAVNSRFAEKYQGLASQLVPQWVRSVLQR